MNSFPAHKQRLLPVLVARVRERNRERRRGKERAADIRRKNTFYCIIKDKHQTGFEFVCSHAALCVRNFRQISAVSVSARRP